MAVDPETRQHLLELAYDVLPEDEAAELRRRIDSEPELSQAYGEARAMADLLAAAARLDEPKIALKRPASNVLAPEPKAAGPFRGPVAARAAAPPRRRWVRETSWIVGIAAAALLVISLSGYFYHRGHLADIAADHLRLRVVGPSQLYRGVGNRYTVTTTSVTGSPLSALVEFTLRSPGGDPIVHKEKTDEKRGELEIALPADLKLADMARLEIRAVYEDKREQIDTQLAVRPIRYQTYLSADKARYRPGETVRYRSVTLSRFGLAADREMPVRFEIADSQGTTLPGSVLEGTTRHGVGFGEFRIPEGAPGGRYAIVATSPQGDFPDQRRTFLVADAGTKSKVVEGVADRPGRVAVRFYPEGGELVAGLENRVYFSARDSLGNPIAIRGTVHDSEGQPVAFLETTSEGRGTFSFSPRSGERYRLQVLHPEGIKDEAKLPAASNDGVLLSAGVGVFPAGRPLSFNVRATRPGIPLVASAWCRGAEVGQKALVTSSESNPVEIGLDDRVAGVIRLTLYDYRTSPPKAVAERLVYRRPARKLQVQIGEVAAGAPTRRSVRLPVLVTDEKSRPTAAVLGVAVAKQSASESAETGGLSMPSHFFLAGEIGRPEELDSADFLLGGDPKSAAALDLLLGTEGWRRFVEKGPEVVVRDDGGEPDRFVAGSPPAVFDNLADLEERYRESLQLYRANRTRPQNALTMLSLFGGVGLVVFVTMLAILNIPTGLRLWVPSVGAALVCLAIGAVLMDPERLQSSPAGAVAFAPFQPAPALSDNSRAEGLAGDLREESKAAEPAEAGAIADNLEELAERDEDEAGAELGASMPAAALPVPETESMAAPEDMPISKAGGAKKMPAGPPAAPAEAEHRRLMSNEQHGTPAKAAKAKGGSQPATFVVRQYSYRVSPDAAKPDAVKEPTYTPETLYWHPLLLTGADGRATVEFDFPETSGDFRIVVDAHAAGGRLGSAQREVPSVK